GFSIRMQIFLALFAIVGAFAFGLGLMVVDRIEARAVRLATEAAGDEAKVIAGMIASEMARTGASLYAVAGRFEEARIAGANLTVEVVDARGQVVFPKALSVGTSDGTVSMEAPIASSEGTTGTVRVVKPTI